MSLIALYFYFEMYVTRRKVNSLRDKMIKELIDKNINVRPRDILSRKNLNMYRDVEIVSLRERMGVRGRPCAAKTILKKLHSLSCE